MFTVGSLFSGIGGLELGLERAGVGETAWQVEVDPHASQVLARHWPDVPNHGDVTAIDWSTVEPVDVLCGGYPCQPFSFAGRRKGTDDHRHLWPYFADALRVVRPRWAVLENVAGHLGLGFDAVLADLAEAGFDATWACLRASDVGAPHRRERLFVLAADASRGELQRWREPRDVAGPAGRAAGEAPQRERDGGAFVGGGPAVVDAPGGGWWPAGFECWLGAAERGEDASDADQLRCQGVAEHDGEPLEASPEEARREHPDRRREPATDTEDERRERGGEPWGGRARPEDGRDWGEYASVVERWGCILGRSAPAPVDDRGRLNPPFVEWMMGFPAGWVDHLGRGPSLRCLGNAVVPQCSTVIGWWLLDLTERM